MYRRPSAERFFKLGQKHQCEGPDFIHPIQCLEECDIRTYIHNIIQLEDDDELGEHWGGDGQEYLHDDRMTVRRERLRRPESDL